MSEIKLSERLGAINKWLENTMKKPLDPLTVINMITMETEKKKIEEILHERFKVPLPDSYTKVNEIIKESSSEVKFVGGYYVDKTPRQMLLDKYSMKLLCDDCGERPPERKYYTDGPKGTFNLCEECVLHIAKIGEEEEREKRRKIASTIEWSKINDAGKPTY